MHARLFLRHLRDVGPIAWLLVRTFWQDLNFEKVVMRFEGLARVVIEAINFVFPNLVHVLQWMVLVWAILINIALGVFMVDLIALLGFLGTLGLFIGSSSGT